ALSFLSSIPNMHVMAPKNKWELSDMLKFAVEFGGPIAIRYPRGEAFDGLKEHRAPIVYGKSEMLFEEKDILLLAVGSMVKVALTVRERLKEKGLSCSLVNARFVKPIDEELIREACKTHGLIVTMEENVASGGFGDRVRAFVDSLDAGIKVLGVAIPDEYVEHGNVELLKQETGIDAASVEEKVCAAWRAFIDKQGV
ncbi:MAG: 1-deoxy-D-xylulose-5-phosphate synthase, partial [Lachnospiraceae bacterium]|nr:1-deoxy-D-xylulose-5-phosphate synthase [Lachnospiraceae bacterium]